jgi:hypothetical protein
MIPIKKSHVKYIFGNISDAIRQKAEFASSAKIKSFSVGVKIFEYERRFLKIDNRN